MLAAMLLIACASVPRGQTAALMDDIESFISESPDSALAVLERVDSAALTTRALRARYALLRTMALDKCFKDITTPGLLEPAVDWYSDHGSPDERFKTWHYSGRIAQDKGDRSTAALCYARAEALADQVTDKHALGLMYLAFGSLYNSVHNAQKELEYIEKALQVFEATGDPMAVPAIGQKALVYHSRQQWTEADSLYRIGIERSGDYPNARLVYLSNYARMKVLQPDKDPVGTIALLDRKRQESGGGLSPEEAGAYAYALALSGDGQNAASLFRQLEAMSSARNAVLPWLYRKAQLDGDADKALALLQEMWAVQNTTIQDDLTDSVSAILQDYFSLQVSHERDRKRIAILLTLIALLLFAGVSLVLLLRKRKVEIERERLMSVCDSLRQDLEQQEGQLASLSGELKHVGDLSAQLEEARAIYKRERIIRLRQAGDVASIVLQRERKWIDNDRAWKKVREELFYVHHLDGNGEELVRRMDHDLNGVISRLRSDLGLRGQPEEVFFLCCCILDIDAQLLADLFGKSSVDAVYKKRSRLKEKIAALGNPEYDLLFKIRSEEESLQTRAVLL